MGMNKIRVARGMVFWPVSSKSCVQDLTLDRWKGLSSIVPFIAQSKVVVVLATFESDVISFRKVDPISQVDFSVPFQVSPTILRFLRDSCRLLIPILPSEPSLFRCFSTYFAYCSLPSPFFFFFFSLSSIFPALCLYSLPCGFASSYQIVITIRRCKIYNCETRRQSIFTEVTMK